MQSYFLLHGAHIVKNFMPEWEKVEKWGKENNVVVETVNGDEEPERCQANNVQGFPTIIVKGREHHGERTAEAVIEAIKIE